MEIKPTGPPVDPSSLSRADQPSGVPFKQTKITETAPSAGGQALSAVTSQFKKADLQDPAKVNELLSQCSGELLQSALGQVNRQMSPTDKQYLTDWMQNDPSVRGKLMNYLERVLT